MAGAVDFSAGGYRFLPSVFQFSGGAAALSGHAIERVRFHRPVPLKQGFERVERLITEAGRPLTSFCACELRSPAPFTEQGFRAFNEVYVVTLQKWGLFDGKVNPVARSNVCPQIDPPPEPSFHAFSFTVRARDAAPSFVIAGSAEAKEGGAQATASGPFATARPARRQCAKRRAIYWANSSGGSRRSVLVGRIPRRRRSTPCTIYIHFSPMRSCGAGRRTRG
jgi:hypothetical protein